MASWIDPAYSPHYLAHRNGTPFYGVGHCDAFDLFRYGFDVDKGFGLFDTMAANGENTLVYWPVYSSPFISQGYDDYSRIDLNLIDLVVEDAAKKGIYLIFTVWDHNLLRGTSHPWGNGQWQSLNGFNKLGTLEEFFTGDEMWAWQENLYRYFIARWGYSPAIGMWLTVSEIEGTDVGGHKDAWHAKVNQYFAEHDAYRHPTTASMAGDQWWPAGHAVADVLQIHSYATRDDAIATGPRIAGWTRRMWEAEDKPNFIGEFGTSRASLQPEHLHNGVWASLAAGGAITAMDWNDGSSWGEMTEPMYAQMASLARFAADLPLAIGVTQPLSPTLRLGSSPIVTTTEPPLQVWSMGGQDWGFAWIQDVNQVQTEVKAVREQAGEYGGVTLRIPGMRDGEYRVLPYDTWQGRYLDELTETAAGGDLDLALPAFVHDIAVRWEHR